jgi:hypothetical protein
LKDGEIVETGKHEELVNLNGIYSLLIESVVERQKKRNKNVINNNVIEINDLNNVNEVHERKYTHQKMESIGELDSHEISMDDNDDLEDQMRINADISNPIYSQHLKPNENSK